MKLIKSITLLFAFAAVISSCSSAGGNMTTTEGVGTTVFDMVKNIESGDKEAFLKHFVSGLEIGELAKNEEIVTDAQARQNMANIPVESWNMQLDEMYNSVQELGESAEIDWKTIEFLKFEPEEKVRDGIKGIQGDMYFMNGDQKFEMIVDAIWNGQEYRLVALVGPLED